MSAIHARKKNKSCLGRLLKFLLILCFLIILFFYVTNNDFRENINCGVTGLVANVADYVSSLQEPDSPGFSLSGLWDALSKEIPGFSPEALWSIMTNTAEDTVSSFTSPKPTNGSSGVSTTQKQNTAENVLASLSGSANKTSVCSTRDELIAAIAEKSATKPTSIKVSISSALYTQCGSVDWVTELMYDAGIDWASYTYSQSFGSCTLTLNKIKYLDAVPCTSLYQFKTLLKGAESTGSISIRPSASLYTQLKEDDWALLYAAQGECGIIDGSFSSYKEPKRVLVFSDLIFADNFYSVSSVTEIKKHFLASTRTGADSIAFHCSDQLFSKLTAHVDTKNPSIMNTIASNCGVTDGNWAYSSSKNLYYSTGLDYFPGARIVSLYRNNRLNELTARERTLYNKASDIASRCRRASADDYELILNICREISAMADYRLCTDPNCDGCELDNAYGVMLNGGGECDSFTDTFYLISSLAGLDAGYQHGDVTEIYNSDAGSSGHIWNTVTLNGKSYFVEMTGANTTAGGDRITPYWMLLGNDVAQLTHIWDKSTAFHQLASTLDDSYSYYHRENCAFTTPAQAAACIKKYRNSGLDSIDVMIINQSSLSNEKCLQQLLDGLRIGGSYSHTFIANRIYVTYYYK